MVRVKLRIKLKFESSYGSMFLSNSDGLITLSCQQYVFILISVHLRISSIICLLVNSLNYKLVSQSRNKIRNSNLVEFPVKNRIRHSHSADPIFRNFERCRLNSSLSEVLSFQFHSIVFVFPPTQASEGSRLPRDVVQEASEGTQGLYESHRSGTDQ